MTKRGDPSVFWPDKVTSLILQQIDGMENSSQVYVIGATNAPDAIDPALLRGGRLSIQIEIPLPGKPQREQLFGLFLKKAKKGPDVNLGGLADRTEGHSGADIEEICRRAILLAAERASTGSAVLTQKDLTGAIEQYKKLLKVYRVPEYFQNRKIGF